MLKIVYHKGPGIKKSGPKGNRKAKGAVLQAICDEIDSKPSQSSFSISDRVYKKTGVRISPSRIRAIRHERGKSRSWRKHTVEAETAAVAVVSTHALR